jgi:hypothetical protein
MGRKERSGDRKGEEAKGAKRSKDRGREALADVEEVGSTSESRVLQTQAKAKKSTARKHEKLLENSSEAGSTAYSSATFALGGKVKTPLCVEERKSVKIVSNN